MCLTFCVFHRLKWRQGFLWKIDRCRLLETKLIPYLYCLHCTYQLQYGPVQVKLTFSSYYLPTYHLNIFNILVFGVFSEWPLGLKGSYAFVLSFLTIYIPSQRTLFGCYCSLHSVFSIQSYFGALKDYFSIGFWPWSACGAGQLAMTVSSLWWWFHNQHS